MLKQRSGQFSRSELDASGFVAVVLQLLATCRDAARLVPADYLGVVKYFEFLRRRMILRISALVLNVSRVVCLCTF